MSTLGNLIESMMLALGLVLCIGFGGAVLFWSANAVERQLHR